MRKKERNTINTVKRVSSNLPIVMMNIVIPKARKRIKQRVLYIR